VAVLEFDPEHGVGQGLADYALHFYGFFFGHKCSLSLEYAASRSGTCVCIRSEIVCIAVMNVNKGGGDPLPS
jgi:hypothetical protein